MAVQKILIVDDDRNICEVLKIYLSFEGYELFFAGDGSTALDSFRANQPDLVILDLMLPIINGWEVCKMIRLESQVPIMMLTAKESVDDKITGLDIGADDYIVKPFDPKEVVARVKAILRRIKAPEATGQRKESTVSLGELRVNLATYEVWRQDQLIELKTKEMQLLSFLIENPNIVFSREQLLEKVWGYDFTGETRTVDVHIQRLREKLEYPDATWKIKTVWGVGYKLEVK